MVGGGIEGRGWGVVVDLLLRLWRRRNRVGVG